MKSFKGSGVAKSSYNLRVGSSQETGHPPLPLRSPVIPKGTSQDRKALDCFRQEQLKPESQGRTSSLGWVAHPHLPRATGKCRPTTLPSRPHSHHRFPSLATEANIEGFARLSRVRHQRLDESNRVQRSFQARFGRDRFSPSSTPVTTRRHARAGVLLAWRVLLAPAASKGIDVQTLLSSRQGQIFPRAQKYNGINSFGLAAHVSQVPLDGRSAPASISRHFGSLRTSPEGLRSPNPPLFKPRDTRGLSARPE